MLAECELELISATQIDRALYYYKTNSENAFVYAQEKDNQWKILLRNVPRIQERERDVSENFEI